MRALKLSLVIGLYIFLFNLLPPSSLLAGVAVGGNGDEVSAFVAAAGKAVLHEIDLAYLRGQEIFPRGTAYDSEKAHKGLSARLVLKNETDLSILTNEHREVKSVKVPPFEKNVVIYLRESVFRSQYERKSPDYREILHAYLLAAGYDDQENKLSLLVPEALFEQLPGYVLPPERESDAFEFPETVKIDPIFTQLHFLSAGGLIGLSPRRFFSEPILRDAADTENLVVRLDERARMKWVTFPNRLDEIYGSRLESVLPTTDGGFLILGEASNSRPNLQARSNSLSFAMKLKASGRRQWFARYHPGEKNLKALELPGGKYLVLTNRSVHVLTAGGNIDPQYQFPSTEVRFHDLKASSDGGFILAGMKEKATGGGYPYLVKLSPALKLSWEKTYENFNGVFQQVIESKTLEWVVAGVRGIPGKSPAALNEPTPIAARFSSSGKLLWNLDLFSQASGSGAVQHLFSWGKKEDLVITTIEGTPYPGEKQIPFHCPESFTQNTIGSPSLPFSCDRIRDGRFVFYRVKSDGKIADREPQPEGQMIYSVSALKDLLLVSNSLGTRTIRAFQSED